MPYTKSPELRGQVIITGSEAPNRFEIASNGHALVDTAADSLLGLITDHFRAHVSSQLDVLSTDSRPSR